jgi:ABC-type sugar transport system permease subunit
MDRLDTRQPGAGRVLGLAGGWLAVGVVFNLILVLLQARTGGPVLERLAAASPRITQVVALPAGRLAVATVDNEVLLLEGDRVQLRRRLTGVIGGLGYDPGRSLLYAGTADGRVTALSLDLTPQIQVPVSGRVVALQVDPEGDLLVAHGIGAFSDRYYVSRLTPGGQTVYSQRVEFTITDQIIYSTANGRVGALRRSDGQPLWTVVVTRPPTRLVAVPQQAAILVGDDRGNISLLRAHDGAVLWEVTVTPYPIRSLAADRGGQLLLAGDSQGGLFLLDNTGRLLFSQRAAEGSIEAFVPAGEEWIVLPREGAWLHLRPQRVAGTQQAAHLRLLWIGGNAALVLLLAAGLVLTQPRLRRGGQALGRALARSRTGYLFIAPSMALILLFSYYPAVLAFYYSFTDFSVRNVTAEFVGLQNYVTILRDDFYFRVGFGNMILILVTGILKVLSVPLLAAELVFWLKNHVHRYIFRTLVVFPAVVPGLVTTLLWRLIYEPNVGLLNQLLRTLGLGHLQRAWLGDEQTAIWAIIGAGFPFLSAFAFLIYLGGLLNINPELYDSAQIDGANWLRRFWHIDVPLLEPQFRLLLFFAFTGAIQGFANIYIYTRGGPGYATYVPALQMYLKIADGGDFGYASAIGVLLFGLIFLGTVVILRFRREVAVQV